MTTGVFQYLDPTSLNKVGSAAWTKVDTDVSSYSRSERRRSVADIRTSSLDFGTDISGFAVYNSPANEKSFTNDAAVRTGYYTEVEELLRAKLPGIKKVVIFDHTIRRREASSPRQPVQQVHVDQTPRAAEVRVRRHVPADEAEELLKGRYQIINVWRPISHPATDFPLAVIDWRSTVPKDLVKVDLLYPKREDGADDDDRGKEVRPDPQSAQSAEGYEVKGELWAIAPNENHKFYYAKDMTPDEAMFIKCYDSRGQGQPGGKEGLAVLTPHTAFIDPATPADAKGRQSIEVRCLVFYE
ncbi:7alpha-cephem-methoxylase p8 chain related protein [Ilyonectria robusta]